MSGLDGFWHLGLVPTHSPEEEAGKGKQQETTCVACQNSSIGVNVSFAKCIKRDGEAIQSHCGQGDQHRWGKHVMLGTSRKTRDCGDRQHREKEICDPEHDMDPPAIKDVGYDKMQENGGTYPKSDTNQNESQFAIHAFIVIE